MNSMNTYSVSDFLPYFLEGAQTNSAPQVQDPRENPILPMEPTKFQISVNDRYGWCAILATINSFKAMVRDYPKKFENYQDYWTRKGVFKNVCHGSYISTDSLIDSITLAAVLMLEAQSILNIMDEFYKSSVELTPTECVTKHGFDCKNAGEFTLIGRALADLGIA